MTTIPLTLPLWARRCIADAAIGGDPVSLDSRIRLGLARFNVPDPVVSIVIPAWNEEDSIVRTLLSFASMDVTVPTELIVVNNNSTDRTQEILERLGVRTIQETRQGVSFARQAGLMAARGSIHLCADADSIYPPTWIGPYVSMLSDQTVSCAYERYSFIPPNGSSRFPLYVYEVVTDKFFRLKRRAKEFLYVRGANFGFRTADGIAAGGFDTSSMVLEDGRMGLALSGLGRIRHLDSADARIWTDARRLTADGSLGAAFTRRVGKEIKRIPGYLSLSRKALAR